MKLIFIEKAFWELVNKVIENPKAKEKAETAKAKFKDAKAAEINTFFDDYIKDKNNQDKYNQDVEKAIKEAKAKAEAAEAKANAEAKAKAPED